MRSQLAKEFEPLLQPPPDTVLLIAPHKLMSFWLMIQDSSMQRTGQAVSRGLGNRHRGRRRSAAFAVNKKTREKVQAGESTHFLWSQINTFCPHLLFNLFFCLADGVRCRASIYVSTGFSLTFKKTCFWLKGYNNPEGWSVTGTLHTEPRITGQDSKLLKPWQAVKVVKMLEKV